MDEKSLSLVRSNTVNARLKVLPAPVFAGTTGHSAIHACWAGILLPEGITGLWRLLLRCVTPLHGNSFVSPKPYRPTLGTRNASYSVERRWRCSDAVPTPVFAKCAN